MNLGHVSHISYSLDSWADGAQIGPMEKTTTRLGASGPLAFPFALGCMGMGAGGWYGASDDAEGIATIHAALDAGVNLIDTGDFYGMGKNELLVGRALAGRRREQVLLSVKFGGLRGPDGAFLGYDARPAATKNFLAHSLSRLGVDYIDIYRPSRLDPAVPIEDTIGAIADMVKAGYVRYIGLSEVGVETIRRAAKVHPICDLQIEYSLVSRVPERAIFPALAELGIGATTYGVLSRGLLTGSRPAAAGDFRAHLPRFAGENGEKNRGLAAALARLAADRGVTPGQLAIAWVRAKGAAQNVTVVPTIGARTRAQLADALGGLAITLDSDELARLEGAVPAAAVAGSRYAAPLMAMLDSER
jgi:aryl-alcohol dehydrogenase-like predicted oxidoreductase